jgi:SAM-dependent methyltransferase
MMQRHVESRFRRKSTVQGEPVTARIDRVPGVDVLQSWAEVGAAINDMNHRHYRLHRTPAKTWDLTLIREMVEDVGRDELIVDLGASVLGAVRLLHEMGFSRVAGYDLSFSIFDRALQIRDWVSHMARRGRPAAPPYRLYERDLFGTGLPDESASAVIALSVVEHNVALPRFFAEAARILRDGGRLFVSTDYWSPKLDTSARTMFGVPWKIFCEAEIDEMIALAERAGLTIAPRRPGDLVCRDHVVRDGSLNYTFVGLRFRKQRGR